MFSSEVASTSTLALHHDHEDLPQWHAMSIIDQVATAANEAIFSTLELVVQAEHSLESIAEHFGIHSFGHHIASKNLTGCTLVLTADHHLEIYRPGVVHATRFPVMRKIAEAA